MRIVIALFFGISLVGCNNPKVENGHTSCTDSLVESKIPDTIPSTDSSSSHFSMHTFKNRDGLEGYGFDIYQEGKMMIHQNSIPAIQGNKGFSTEEEAKAVGALMLYRISNGIMPPSISIEDLDSLGVKYSF
ncbi:MAG: DUF4907 domain-containing protein [Bacteroidetes bacterium]|nr:DUF4907 domain-containing protein [Bacteroidota bacterium]